MFNSIIFFNRIDDSNIQFLLSKKEFEAVKNSFCWKIGVEGFVTSCEDFFSASEVNIFREKFKSIYDDFNVDEYYVSFHPGIYFFTIDSLLEEIFAPIIPGPCRGIYDQLMPLNGRPMFEHPENFLSEWYYELGVYKKCPMSNLSDSHFIHPVTNRYLFEKEADYPKFLEKFYLKMEKAKKIDSSGDMFIRVINVYDKVSKILKYRIINDDFIMSGLDTILEPYEGDDILFIRSYEVTQEIANYIARMYINKIEFDFNKNDYYLETLQAKDFIYSYKDLIKGLVIKEDI